MKPEIAIIEKEKYVLVKEFFAENIEGYRTFWQDLCEKCPGWEIDFVYRNCEPPAEFLESIGVKLIDSAIIMELTKENFRHRKVSADEIDTVPITADNYSIFALIHDKANPEMFWTSERIAEKPDRWRIYMNGSSYVMMSLWGDESEIFALEVQNADEGAALLSTAVKFAFEIGKHKVLYFVSDDVPMLLASAQQVGFATCGTCATYQGIVL